jgi:dephospho-CoA kinase
LVRRELARVVAGAKRGVVVLDIPLLYESRLEKTVDEVLVVWASRDVRIRRLMKDGRFSRRDIRARMKAQLPLSGKRRRAHHVVDNGGPLSRTLAQVQSIYTKFTTP